MIEPSDRTPEVREAQIALRDGIERTREMCADTKKRLQELADSDRAAAPESATP